MYKKLFSDILKYGIFFWFFVCTALFQKSKKSGKKKSTFSFLFQASELQRYLEHCVFKQCCVQPVVHNFLLSIYAEYDIPRLLDYLKQRVGQQEQVHADWDYLLRLCVDKRWFWAFISCKFDHFWFWRSFFLCKFFPLFFENAENWSRNVFRWHKLVSLWGSDTMPWEMKKEKKWNTRELWSDFSYFTCRTDGRQRLRLLWVEHARGSCRVGAQGTIQ